MHFTSLYTRLPKNTSLCLHHPVSLHYSFIQGIFQIFELSKNALHISVYISFKVHFPMPASPCITALHIYTRDISDL